MIRYDGFTSDYPEKYIIIPQRFIPFDIGCHIDNIDLDKIKKLIIAVGGRCQSVPGLLESISEDVILYANINVAISLYVFSYGIGVFVIEDDFETFDDAYSVGYCDNRRNVHRSILEFNYKGVSDIIENFIDAIRELVSKRHELRNSANKSWEFFGLSYVMTVSYIIKPGFREGDYESLTEEEKKNLQIMLQPSIACKEDTLSMDDFASEIEAFDPMDFDVSKLQEPRNFMKSSQTAVYISWAAVLVYLNNLKNNRMHVVECIEVDLQAMWMFTYCQYVNMKEWISKKRTVLDLKHEKHMFLRRYNEFISDRDSCVPVYVSEIRNEMIRTSRIEEQRNNYIEYMDYCIDETVTFENQKQHKYSVISELLLFAIAFVEIAPILYGAILGEYNSIQVGPAAIVFGIMLLGIWVIIRKG